MKEICIGIEQLSKGQVKQNEHTSGKMLRWLYVVLCTVPVQLSVEKNLITIFSEVKFKHGLKHF